MHLCLDAASAVVSAPSSPQGSGEIFGGPQNFISRGGAGGDGTNPEQLFAMGYAACFDSALNHVAQQKKLALMGSKTSAEVGIGQTPEGGFKLDIDIHVEIAGLDEAAAQKLLAALCDNLGLPAADVVRFGCEPIVEAVLEERRRLSEGSSQGERP